MPTSPILGKPVHDIMQVRGKTRRIVVNAGHQSAITGSAPMANRKIVVVYNNGDEPIEYCFDTDTTFGNGMPVQPGEQESIAAGEGVAIYLVGGLGSHVDVRIIEGY